MNRLRAAWFPLVIAGLMISAAYGGTPQPMKVEARLVWGTNDEKSDHKKVDEALANRLSKSPFRWKHYFEVNKLDADLASQQSKELKMSDRCTVEVKNLGDGRIEVKLHGDGKLVSRNVEPLPEGWPLILSGNAKNDTAWLVVIQRATNSVPKPK